MKHIDIAGLGHTGKEALSDFCREFEIFAVPHPTFEFNLLRMPGGLLDLKKSIYDNWSMILSNSEYERFKNNINRVGYKASFKNFKKLWLSNGFNYETELNQNFTDISHKYLESLVLLSEETFWPFDLKSPFEVNFNRFKKLIGLKGYSKSKIRLLDKDKFLLRTRDYLDDIYVNSKYLNNKTVFSVSHNAFDPNRIDDCLDMFHDAYSIIVLRDPRDVYASLFEKNTYIPKYEQNQFFKNHKFSFLMANSLKNFLLRQEFLNISISKTKNKKFLKIWFEDLVINYDETLDKISSFLGINLRNYHKNKKKFFDPNISRKNINLWNKFDNKILKQFDANLSQFYYPGK